MTRATVLTKWTRWGGRITVLLGFAVGVIVLTAWLAGKFAPKVPANPKTPLAPSTDVKGSAEPVRLVRLPRYESAVGTVRAVHEATIGSRLLARVMEVKPQGRSESPRWGSPGATGRHGFEGQDIGVQVERLQEQCSGTVSEIVPEAQSNSRTFQVKVTGPCPPGIYSGMFGRILIPLGEEEVLVSDCSPRMVLCGTVWWRRKEGVAAISWPAARANRGGDR